MSSDVVDVKRDAVFRAVQYNNSDDYHKIFDMINKCIKYDAMSREYFIKTNRGSMYIVSGDWVVLNTNTGCILVLSDKEFKGMFDVK